MSNKNELPELPDTSTSTMIGAIMFRVAVGAIFIYGAYLLIGSM